MNSSTTDIGTGAGASNNNPNHSSSLTRRDGGTPSTAPSGILSKGIISETSSSHQKETSSASSHWKDLTSSFGPITHHDTVIINPDKLDEEILDEKSESSNCENISENEESFSAFLLLMVCVTAVTGFLMGYDLCIVAVVLGPIRDYFQVCPAEMSGGDGLSGDSQPCVMNELFVAILAPGAMISSLIGGWAADKFGRRSILIASDIFFASAATIMSLSSTYWGMLIGRSLLGVGIGMGFVVFPTYMAEVSPADVRGALVTCQEVAQCIGCLAAYAVAYFVNPVDHWRLLLFCAGIPALLQLVGTLMLPESPRWLVRQKKVRKARIALERIAGQRPMCGEPKDKTDELEARNAFVDQLLASPSAMSGSDLSRLSRVRATRLLLSDESARRLSGAEFDEEVRSTAMELASRSVSRLSLEMDGPGAGGIAGPGGVHGGGHDLIVNTAMVNRRQPPLATLLDLMEEQELREENKARKREERRLRHAEEIEAAREEGTLGLLTKMKFGISRFISPSNFSGISKLLNHKRELLIACGCAVAQNFTGANTILYYSVDLMRMGSICDPLFTGVMIGVVKLMGVTLMLLYLEKVGRRLPLIVGTTGTVLCHCALSLTFKFAEFDACPALGSEQGNINPFPNSPKSIAVMGLLWGLMFFWNISWAGLMFVVASEVLPSSIRGTGMGVAIATFWILAFVFQLGFRLTVLAMTAAGTFITLAATSILVLLFVYFFVPDLTGKTLEEINKE